MRLSATAASRVLRLARPPRISSAINSCLPRDMPAWRRAPSLTSLPLLRMHMHILRQGLPTQRTACRAAHFSAADICTDVGVMVEGSPRLSEAELEELAEALYAGGKEVVRQAALHMVQQEEPDRTRAPGPLELSLVLCDDAHIAALNAEWRGVEGPTDVLSFEMQGDGDEEDFDFDWEEEQEGEGDEDEDEEALDGESSVSRAADEEAAEAGAPATLLGDVVISVDTAARQAEERGHSLLDECRILLVHGVLHLLGYDHEEGGEAEVEMAAAEAAVMQALGWKGRGLIAAAGDGDMHAGDASASDDSSSSQAAAPGTPAANSQRRRRSRPEVRLLALDMDGTLLDSSSKVLPSSVDALRAALDRGVNVVLATGKARPAAIKAMQSVGLAGDNLVVSPRGPGIFLQGLAVYGLGGEALAGGQLSPEMVAAAWTFAQEHNVSLCGFLGEECVTPAMTRDIRSLHERYYEPLAFVEPSLEAVLAGPPIRKLLFMADAADVDARLRPHWDAALRGSGAGTMQAVPDMLELVPTGVCKWVGMQALLAQAGLPADAMVAVGDGANDLTLVANAGVGVAMGNAVAEVKAAAAMVVASNDEGGVAEAIHKLILS